MNQLEVLTFTNQTKYKEWREKFNPETRILMNQVYKYYINECETIGAKEVFRDWWNGASVWNKEYKNKFNVKDFKQAEDCILEACSRGFG